MEYKQTPEARAAIIKFVHGAVQLQLTTPFEVTKVDLNDPEITDAGTIIHWATVRIKHPHITPQGNFDLQDYTTLLNDMAYFQAVNDPHGLYDNVNADGLTWWIGDGDDSGAVEMVDMWTFRVWVRYFNDPEMHREDI